MTTALTSALSSPHISPDTAGAPILPGSAEATAPEAPSSQTDFLQIESIVLNLDASLRVHARAHFFSWTQGLLQSLIRHELLICTLCLGKPPAFRADGFSMTTPEPTLFSDMFLRDTAVAPTLLKTWEERRYQPVVVEVSGGNGAPATLGSGGFVRELEKLGATQLLVHGVHDAEGRALSLFTFACRPSSVTARQAYLAQLLAPSLHAAWVRTQLAKRTEAAGDKAGGGSVLTVRELDILKWIYLGKSNFEIGAILKISPLTVKNHVQKILRKLNVVNRTQAIGKALELRILNP
ncbi:MAG TPA: XrtB/PEP-CTERM-associated transcriptional regulator EpsA [Burkholderiales bacterium]|jgi:transcriptional regulator EpsA|nr:XrtB/PEP-CTERM-associated transcriptional regulator EpsA [Burkholderiales bacterium]